MQLLYQTVGTFFEGDARDLLKHGENPYVDIKITTEGFEFYGKYIELQGIVMDSRGFEFKIPWTEIHKIIKTKIPLHCIRIVTNDGMHYHIAPLDIAKPIHGIGISDMKKNAKILLEAIDKAKKTIAELIVCPKCGEKLKSGSTFCGQCGTKIE